MIQTVKKNIKKALKGNDGPYLALLAVRTSLGPENKTPLVTLFYNRTIRTLINTKFSQEIKNLTLSNSTQHQKTSPPLKVNDLIRLQDGKSWTIMGKKIKKIGDIPRSYLIETKKNILRRNRQHILIERRKKQL